MTYERKVGFFGSIKALGTNTVKGADLVVNDAIGITTDITGGTRVVSTVARQAMSIWGDNLLADLEADKAIDGIHREIASIQQTSELDALKAELAKAKVVQGRPKGSRNKPTEKVA